MLQRLGMPKRKDGPGERPQASKDLAALRVRNDIFKILMVAVMRTTHQELTLVPEALDRGFWTKWVPLHPLYRWGNEVETKSTYHHYFILYLPLVPAAETEAQASCCTPQPTPYTSQVGHPHSPPLQCLKNLDSCLSSGSFVQICLTDCHNDPIHE
jgi:hypothetical protein